MLVHMSATELDKLDLLDEVALVNTSSVVGVLAKGEAAPILKYISIAILP